MFLTGKQIGRFYLQRLIEQGGMGDIYLAIDTHLQRRVAFKVLNTAINAETDTVAINEAVHLFKREANAVTQLDHPHILPLYDYGEETIEGVLLTYIVMPYRSEGSLAGWVSKRKRSGGLTLYDAAHFLRQAASALQYAHDHGIIHRDVKPSNFLIMSNKQRPGRPDVQLADFGVAKFMRAISTPTGVIRGTPLYMAPEFWSGSAVPASDQYALALMIYEMLTGVFPFKGETPEQLFYQHMYVEPPPASALNKTISNEVNAVLMRALSKNPASRYASVSAFARAFQQALVQKGAIASPPLDRTQEVVTLASSDVVERTAPVREIKSLPPMPVRKKPPNRNKRNFSLIGAVMLLMLSGVGIAIFSTFHQVNGPKPVVSASQLQSETAIGRAHANQTAGANQNATATSLASNATNTAVAASAAAAAAAATATSVSATQTAISSTKTAVAGATATSAAATATAYGNFLRVGPNQLKDPLQSSNTGFDWDTVDISSGVGCTYLQGTYLAGVTLKGNFSACFEHQYTLSDFSCQVNMAILQGDRGGIAFRADSNTDTFYYFYIDTHGNYGLALVNSFNIGKPLKQGSNPAIRTGLNQINQIAVVAEGNTITLFVNMQIVDQVTDSTNTSGNIGLVAQDVNSTTYVSFSDAQISY
ncbi:MAG TPA: serine/threonine-protein kinase [Ktedonobacteraceae bacterium]|nr:serine/threonine-protein kinase [Ktedonobacteraceae bacterium]